MAGELFFQVNSSFGGKIKMVRENSRTILAEKSVFDNR